MGLAARPCLGRTAAAAADGTYRRGAGRKGTRIGRRARGCRLLDRGVGEAVGDPGLAITDRYLAWIEILAEKTEEDIAGLDPDVLAAFRQALQYAPSLLDLAHGNIACIASLQAIREKAPENERALLGWIDRVMKAFERSKWLAGEMLASCERLIRVGTRALRIDQHALPLQLGTPHIFDRF